MDLCNSLVFSTFLLVLALDAHKEVQQTKMHIKKYNKQRAFRLAIQHTGHIGYFYNTFCDDLFLIKLYYLEKTIKEIPQ